MVAVAVEAMATEGAVEGAAAAVVAVATEEVSATVVVVATEEAEEVITADIKYSS